MGRISANNPMKTTLSMGVDATVVRLSAEGGFGNVSTFLPGAFKALVDGKRLA
jgi:hypothetical protein